MTQIALRSMDLYTDLFASTANLARYATTAVKIIAASAVLSCLTRTIDPPGPIVIDVVEAGSPMPDQDPYFDSPVPLCLHRDRIVLKYDGGVIEYDTPRPCLPMKYRELGDPPDVRLFDGH